MSETVFDGKFEHNIEIVKRDSNYFIRYDAGSHHVFWREDEISASDFLLIKRSVSNIMPVLIKLQKDLLNKGVDAYISNFKPD